MAEAQVVFDVMPRDAAARVCIRYPDANQASGYAGVCQDTVDGRTTFNTAANLEIDYSVHTDVYAQTIGVGKVRSGMAGSSTLVPVSLVIGGIFNQLPRGTLASVGFLFALGAASVLASRR